ncbi:putative leucine-rich repeat-containing protein DDB_G0290503 isoform X2 [Macadamia integrifolia]|uniref:putative leucine-rich repeat-containing protein DDB_G0290503 isoform X2 n=1 Tax=Macadamia integrifolia TaxID=60698 RepID=UPI001C4ED6DE|nr:putative leucine-rich repeat-containing protein DDB_G0290503 isoform X2 [Macadamia integrifolia]
MTEHQGRDEIKSLLGSHVAPEKTDPLEETRKEIENKVKRILKPIKVEGKVGNLNVELQLVDLVVEYYKQHKSLNAHHDDHTAELKEKFHYQERTSSSQYSDSDHSSKGKAEKASGSIKQQIEAANDKGKKFCEDLQARDEKEQRIIQGLQLELASLQTQKKELEEQFEEQNLKLQLVQTGLRDKILELERISKEKEDNQSKLKLQIAGEEQEDEGRKILAMEKNIELASKVVNLQKALKRSIEKHRQLLDQSQETYLTNLGLKDEMIDSGIELTLKMKEEIIIRSKAITRLQDEINTAESNLQISNNNLHVTEQLLAKKKEVYRKEEEKFQQECTELKEQNSKLSNEIDTAQRDLIEIRSSLEKTRNSFSGLEVVFQEFQENDSSFQSRIVEVSEALWIVKKLLVDTNGKIEELEKRLNVKEDEVLKIEEEKK